MNTGWKQGGQLGGFAKVKLPTGGAWDGEADGVVGGKLDRAC